MRPELPDLSVSSGEDICPCPKEYSDLICKCWADKPTDRPNFDYIKKTISRINPDKRNPVDMMMALVRITRIVPKNILYIMLQTLKI